MRTSTHTAYQSPGKEAQLMQCKQGSTKISRVRTWNGVFAVLLLRELLGVSVEQGCLACHEILEIK
jgi:hypothetical protein